MLFCVVDTSEELIVERPESLRAFACSDYRMLKEHILRGTA